MSKKYRSVQAQVSALDASGDMHVQERQSTRDCHHTLTSLVASPESKQPRFFLTFI
jgi:hypothetical protein